ncbi:MAG: hypothetical protein IKM99_10380 [Bacteroidales bacterium]|nr:hypothetical protein [Bacteroidales bacterium]
MKKVVFTILTLLFCAISMAQQKNIDSTLVTFYPISFDSISLKGPHYLDTATFHANEFDALSREATIYSTLSNIGLAHKSMRFNGLQPIGFDMSVPTFSKYIKTEKDLKTYLSLLPYSEIRYVMTTGDKEQHLNFKFSRQFFQGFFLSFEYNNNYSPGSFSNSKADNNYCWVNALYSTKDQRYRALAYWFRNKIEVQENGGIRNDSVYISHMESDNSAILTNLNNATNHIKISGAGFQHYFNLLPQFKKETTTENDSLTNDSIIQRRFSLGRINHSFAYQRNQLFYNETSASMPFFVLSDTLFSPRTTDTIIAQSFRNSLYWNSLGYQNYSDDIPFYLYAGMDYDFFKIKRYDYLEALTLNDQSHSQFSIKGGLIINLFKSTTITGQAKLITLGYQIGDFDINGQWRQYLGTTERNYGKLTVDFNMRRQSPTWFESRYQSNHFRWNNEFHAATYLLLGANYQYKWFSVGLNSTTVNDLIYFNQEARPAQHDGLVSISEIYGRFDLALWRFKIEGCCSLQKASNEDVIHLPLFLSKLKVGYSQPIFKKAATLQPSLTIQYFTKYHADAYMPALRTFYLQDDVLIGNFPFIDLALAIKVKQADIYVQYSNMFLLTGNYDAFIAPHYPMRGSKIFIGINCRLFN